MSTKVHVRSERRFNMMALEMTPGQQHESTVFEPLMEQGAVKRKGPGRPKQRSKRAVGDKAYSSSRIRSYARRRGIRHTIPRKSNEKRGGPFDRDVYRGRNRVERFINRIKQFRRTATRYEKRASNFRAMWVIAAIILKL